MEACFDEIVWGTATERMILKINVLALARSQGIVYKSRALGDLGHDYRKLTAVIDELEAEGTLKMMPDQDPSMPHQLVLYEPVYPSFGELFRDLYRYAKSALGL